MSLIYLQGLSNTPALLSGWDYWSGWQRSATKVVETRGLTSGFGSFRRVGWIAVTGSTPSQWWWRGYWSRDPGRGDWLKWPGGDYYARIQCQVTKILVLPEHDLLGVFNISFFLTQWILVSVAISEELRTKRFTEMAMGFLRDNTHFCQWSCNDGRGSCLHYWWLWWWEMRP